ncbi:MAG TPA: COX15/CtaA family protein [Novosphingobium sp.]|nr:COX15/CtaA family protein [Novosphingobium sp.]
MVALARQGVLSSDDAEQPGVARPAALARWLFAVAALIVAIVVVGGITRLTESGLSITQWQPVTGVLPPLSDAQWQAEFARYQRIPEYVEINGPAGMTLAQYQAIYFWEWLHRLLARAIGLAFAAPLAWFWWSRAIPGGYKPRLLALLALGGLQGAIGWWMVASGLSIRTDVSHMRLAAHLLTALLTLGGIVWIALDLRAVARDRAAAPARLDRFSALVLAMLTLQLLLGAWMAGLDAGYVASDWPTMQGALFPVGVDGSRGPLWAAANDPYLVHFLHRWWAFAVVAGLVVMARRLRSRGERRASVAIHSAFGVQIVLGIATVMSGVAIVLAVLHQLVGALLVVVTVWGAHALGQRA